MSEIVQSLTSGFLLNVLIFFSTLVGAVPLGILIMFGTRSKVKPLAWLFKTVVWIIRGTPLMLQLIAVFFLPSIMFGQTFDRVTAAIIACIINYAC